MLKLVSFCILFSGISLSAAPIKYDINMSVSMNGKQVASSRLQTFEGKVTTVVQDTNTQLLSIDLVANKVVVENKKSIQLDFKISKTGKFGKKELISTPQVLTDGDNPAKILVNNGSSSLSVLVTAKETKN